MSARDFISFTSVVTLWSTSERACHGSARETQRLLLLGGLDCLEGCCDAFTQIRDSLMEVMSSGHTVMEPNSTNAMCLDCQGKVTERHGLKLYVKTGVGALEPYDYDPLERSVELLRAAVGDAAMDTVQQLMFQKCFCFLASSAST